MMAERIETLTVHPPEGFDPSNSVEVQRFVDTTRQRYGSGWRLVTLGDGAAIFEHAVSAPAVNSPGLIYDSRESEASWRGRGDPLPASVVDAEDIERDQMPPEPVHRHVRQVIRSNMDDALNNSHREYMSNELAYPTRRTHQISVHDALIVMFVVALVVFGATISWQTAVGIAVALALVGSVTYGYVTATSAAQRRREIDQFSREARAPIQAAWRDLVARYDAVMSQWDAYESDPEKFLAQPDIRNVAVPEVADAIRALMTARMLRTDTAPDDVTDVAASHFAASVTEAEIAVAKAVQVTRDRVRTAMSADERRTLLEAQRILSLALDSAATPQERQLAYRRCRRLLETIGVELPDTVKAAIAARHRPLIVGQRGDSVRKGGKDVNERSDHGDR